MKKTLINRLSALTQAQITKLREELNIDPSKSDDEVVEDDLGWGSAQSYASTGETVERGDLIRVTEVDSRILESLPDDEVSDLKSFIGEVFPVVHINFDGSLYVEKEWLEDGELFSGHGLAVFPGQYELVTKEEV